MAMTTRNTTSNTQRENDVPSKQHRRFTPQQLEEEERNVYALNMIKSTIRDISVEKINSST